MLFRKKKNTYIISFREKKWKIEFSARDIIQLFKRSSYHFGIFILVIVFVIFITASSSIEAQTANFYAGTCLGEWEGPQQAEGEPSVFSGDSNSFSSENSALSRGKGVSMFCGNFQGNVPYEKAIGKATLSFSLFVGGEYIDENLVIHATTTPGRRAVNGVTYIVNEDGTLSLESSDFEESFYDILDAPEGVEISFILTEESSTTEDGIEDSTVATGTDNGVATGTSDVVEENPIVIEGRGMVDDFYDILDLPKDTSVEYSVDDKILETVTEAIEETTIDTEGGITKPETSVSEEVPDILQGQPKEVIEDESETVSFLEKIRTLILEKISVVYAQEIQDFSDKSKYFRGTSSISNVIEEDISSNETFVDTRVHETEEKQIVESRSRREKIFEQKTPKTIQQWSYEFQKQAVLEVSQTPLFSVEYTFNSVDWEHVGYVSAEKWQDVSFVLPIVSWNDISNVQIRITSSDGVEQTIFLDTLMLSVDYYNRSNPIIEKKTDKRSFSINEPLHFNFKYDKNKGNKRNIVDRAMEFVGGTNKPVVVDTRISDMYGVESDIEATIDYINDTEWVIDIDSYKRKMRPGKYDLIIEVEDDGEIITQYQEFYWGVLAINTNKSIYEPYETADLYIGVLDDTGHTICDASLQLVVIDPVGIETIFTTKDGTIMTSDVCAGDTYVEVPDYSTHYAVSGVGKYTMKLININTEYELLESFEVWESVPFVVEREGPTRIYPPATYEMKITIDAKQDFVGDIYEYLPDTFEIVNVTQDLHAMTIAATSGEAVNTGASVEYGGAYLADEEETQQMLWFLNIYSGDRVTLQYTFDAPDISPEFYLLGPLEFYK